MSNDLEAIATCWAKRRADIHALVLVGSRARTDTPADAWSDYDFVVVVDDVVPFLRTDDWIAELGPHSLSFVEDAAAGGLRERRVLFADGADADFTLLPLARLDAVLARADVAGVFVRGFRVLTDEGVLPDLPREVVPTREDYPGLVHEFWYRAIWTARKLRRGELHVAVQGCNCGLRTLLRRALELEARAAGRDPWHSARFFERWVDPVWRPRMPRTVAPEDAFGAAAAIREAGQLFTDVCDALRERHGFEVSIELTDVRGQLDALLAAPSRAERR